MNPSHFTVARPVFTVMATLIVVSLGIVSLMRLPIDLLPDITYPTLTVSTSYSNAGPEEMEELVTRPIEQAVAAVPGVRQMTSNSSEGTSNVRLAFAWGADIEEAANDVRDRIDRIVNRLPDEADRPRVRKFDVSASPIMVLGASSPMDALELRRLIDEQITYRIERVPGVAAVDVWGGLEREIQVNLDGDKVQALGLSLDSVRQAIRDANVVVPGGEIERGIYEVTLRTPGQFASLDELGATVVAQRDGASIRLGEVADIRDTHRRITRLIRIDGQDGVRLAVRKQADANTVRVANDVLGEIERIRRDFPQLTLVPVRDQSRYIQKSIDNIGNSIAYGGSLAVLVLLFFLRSVRTTVVAAVAIPVSVIATFALIYAGGFTLNLMTLGGLALGVGMMVDNAIVVLESITRKREQEGASATEAAVSGTGEVSGAIVAGTLTTLVIFLPLLFAEELAGVLYRQLALVVGFSLLASLFIALTMTPMLAARFQSRGPATSGVGGRLARACGAALSRIETAYEQLLKRTMAERAAALALAVGLFFGSFMLVPLLGTEFLPAADEAEVRVTVEMDAGTRLELLDGKVRQVEKLLFDAVPEAIATVSVVGGTGFRTGAPASGNITMTLTPAMERTRSSEQVAADLRRELTGIPGTVVRTRAGQGLFLLRLGGGGDDVERLAIEVRGFDLTLLDRIARDVQSAIADVPGITDVVMARDRRVPVEMLRVDRQRAADLGLSVSRIARTIETAIAGAGAGDYREGGYEYRIFVRLKDAERLSLDEVMDIGVLNNTGELVPLRNVVTLEAGLGPLTIERQDQQRISRISANIAGRDLGSVVTDVRDRLATIAVPRGAEIVLAGDIEEQEQVFSELMIGILLAIALVYMVMACLYESLRDPLIVMFSVPFAAIGVILTLLATGTTLNAQSFIGCIMLVGIVVNNAILIVDQAARLHRDQGWTARAAAAEAGRRRLRPILMTSLTTILALVPLALGFGEGAEQQAPLARVVIGGLASSALITLVLIPVMFTLFHPDREKRA